VHLQRLYVEIPPGQSPSVRDFTGQGGTIRQWTLLPSSPSSSALLRYAALACTGSFHVNELCRRLGAKGKVPSLFGQLEFTLVRDTPQEGCPSKPVRLAAGWRIAPPDSVRPIQPKEARDASPVERLGKPPRGAQNVGWLVLGYGSDFGAHSAEESFHFEDPHHRLKRLASLVAPGADVTNPVAYLKRLHWKGVRYLKPRSRQFIEKLNRSLSGWLEVEPDAWLDKRFDFSTVWETLPPWRQKLGMLVLDAARHLFDAAVKLSNPFEQSGVLLLDGPQHWCAPDCLPGFFRLLNGLFPRFQFLVTLPDLKLLPAELVTHGLAVSESCARTKPRRARLPRGTALLIDVDSSLPNLALMKLSRHLREQGKRVVLARRTARLAGASEVYASCVFAFPNSARRVAELRKFYGADLQIGGSGVDVRRRLPREIEALPPDYTLYPEMGDRALGFLTRGCPLHCPFCIVPVKEGKPRLVSDFESLLQGRRKLILLDDNILSHASALPLMEEMLRRELAVNFNQTLDLRLLTPAAASLLRQIRCSNVSFTRRNYYFSLNNNRNLPLVGQRYALLQATGRDNVEFVCLYGFDTTLAQDVERFRFLRSLPGAYVFVQRYRPVLGGPEAALSGFFGPDAEEQINALLAINFTQNMKSMEVYYRWLCLLYAAQCGRIHRRLVETLFRYNGRHRMGGFLAKLESHATAQNRSLDADPNQSLLHW
jgi:hypothetical protein